VNVIKDSGSTPSFDRRPRNSVKQNRGSGDAGDLCLLIELLSWCLRLRDVARNLSLNYESPVAIANYH